MALTEEQIEALRAIGDEWMSQDGRADLEDFIAALPKPEVINWTHLAKWWESGDEDWERFQEVVKETVQETEAPVAPHASAPSEQKPVTTCKTCNGTGGWESCASSTSYFWEECPDCKPNHAPDYKAQRDAERYRFLRDSQEGKTIRIKPRLLWNEEIDAAIASVKGGE